MAASQASPIGQHSTGGSQPGELDLFALLLLLRRHLWRTLILALIGGIVMAVKGLTATTSFSSTATIIVPQKSSSGAASAALQALGGFGPDLMSGSDVLYIDILKSRTVADAIIRQFDLMKVFHVQEIGVAEAALSGSTTILSKDGLILVTVKNHSPQLAADIANAYFVQLHDLNLHLSVTAAGQQRAYYEQQLVREKNALADAEVALQQSQEKTGLISPETQTQTDISAAEQIRAQIRLRQVQLSALEQGATAQNPEVIRLHSEIGSLEGQLKAMETGGGGIDAGRPVAKLPGQTLVYVRAAREVKFHEALFDILSREYENAKQQEARDNSVLQVLDPAIPAVRKSWPPRTLWCLVGFIVGGILGVFYTLAEAMMKVILRNPENRSRMGILMRNGESR